MSERKSKIFGLFIFLVISSVFVFLVITGSKASPKEVYNKIEITGNKLLPAEEYLRYSGLSDSTKYNDLTLSEVKSKFEKHPYMRKAEVEFDGINKILVEVEEKEVKAVLLKDNALKLVTNDLERLPLFPPSNIKELPVISCINNVSINTIDAAGIRFAFRIINAISIVDTNIRKNLAEICLRKSGNVILTFTGLNFPVLFGKDNEVKKTLILKNLWYQFIQNETVNRSTEYIDLRFQNKVFIGKRKSELING